MTRLTAIVLGSAAGGGFPQWNCACTNCRLAWAGDRRVRARTQTSLAVSADGRQWTLLNASPDLRAQIAATADLHANGSPRGSPIAAVVLTGGEIDQTAGLLNLRERQPFALIATSETHAALAANQMFGALAPDLVARRTVAPDAPFDLPGGMSATLFTVPGKVPLYLEGTSPSLAGAAGENVGVEIEAGGARIAFVPGAAAIDNALIARLARADAVFFDATLFTDDEMIRTATGDKTGRRMGHVPVGGEDGSLAALRALRNRRIYIHINNTNPLLLAGSPERREAEAAGWEIAADGLKVAL